MRLALERGFFFPSAEIYPSAPGGFWEYGHLGVLLKNKYIQAWLREFVRRDEMVLIDGSQILPKDVFVASGHLESFADPVAVCQKCGSMVRVDRLLEEVTGQRVPERTPVQEIEGMIRSLEVKCPVCGGHLGGVSLFNMMFKVHIGGAGEEAYLRPETCQSIFIDFPRLHKISRRKLPLAFAQLGKSFRNEIAPRQSLVRLREFYQAEVEVFFNPATANQFEKAFEIRDYPLRISDEGSLRTLRCEEAVSQGILSSWLVAYYLSLAQRFYLSLGVPSEKLRLRRLEDDEKAFYAIEAWDLEVDTSIGWMELVACNNRGSYDLSGHAKVSGTDLDVRENDGRITPHVFELSMGVDRSLLALMDLSFGMEGERAVLRLHPALAPYSLAVFPLVDRPDLVAKARDVFERLRLDFDVFYDESGSIGRRYRRQDEIGTPFCATIDYQTLKDDTLTLRERDTMKQTRVAVDSLKNVLSEKLLL